MTTIEFIYDKDCPNVIEARSNLIRALAYLQLKQHWLEWEINDPDSPDYVQSCGSPTILINGKDISGSSDVQGKNHCRIYDIKNSHTSGVPPVDEIISALSGNIQQANYQNFITKPGIKMSAIPVVIIAFLPKIICPFCWPLYTGLLGSIGINFFNYTPYLFPLLILFLTLTVTGLLAGAKSNGYYWPVYLGIFASLGILTGKFLFESSILILTGIAGLILAVASQLMSQKEDCHACKP